MLGVKWIQVRLAVSSVVKSNFIMLYCTDSLHVIILANISEI